MTKLGLSYAFLALNLVFPHHFFGRSTIALSVSFHKEDLRKQANSAMQGKTMRRNEPKGWSSPALAEPACLTVKWGLQFFSPKLRLSWQGTIDWGAETRETYFLTTLCICVLILSSYKDISLTTLLNLNYLLKGAISKYCHILWC